MEIIAFKLSGEAFSCLINNESHFLYFLQFIIGTLRINVLKTLVKVCTRIEAYFAHAKVAEQELQEEGSMT